MRSMSSKTTTTTMPLVHPLKKNASSQVVDRGFKHDHHKSILSTTTKTTSSAVDSTTENNSNDKTTSKRVTIQSNGSSSNRINKAAASLTITNTAEDKLSYRAKMEARKKARASRTSSKPKKKEVSISAILSQTLDGGDESSDDNDDGIVGNRAISQNTSAQQQNRDSNEKQYTPPETKDHWSQEDNSNSNNMLKSCAPDSDQARKHFKENISPIEEIEGTSTASIKDMDLDYLLNWDPSKRDTTKNQRVGAGTVVVSKNGKGQDKKGMAVAVSAAAPKITRNDLGYMMNWEPFPKSSQDEDDSNSHDEASKASKSKSRSANNNNNNIMTRIEEEDDATDDASAAQSGCDNAITANSGSTCSRDNASAAQQQKRTSMDTHASSKSYGARDKPEKNSNGNNDSMPHVEQSFLPLIETNNVIKVDNQPYAKLGVIGKGGSCKVYRALSRDCDVVALKKVKLDGLNKQAIDGYANEIALLKRLKGNPAIIQLYSSEVDLERKSIFLVMELGEVDLNYVLRQQELLSSK